MSGDSSMSQSRRSKPKNNSSGLKSGSRKSKNQSRGNVETKGGREATAPLTTAVMGRRVIMTITVTIDRERRQKDVQHRCDDDSNPSSPGSSPDSANDDSSSEDEKSGRRHNNARGRRKEKWETRSSVRSIVKIEFRVPV